MCFRTCIFLTSTELVKFDLVMKLYDLAICQSKGLVERLIETHLQRGVRRHNNSKCHRIQIKAKTREFSPDLLETEETIAES